MQAEREALANPPIIEEEVKPEGAEETKEETKEAPPEPKAAEKTSVQKVTA